MILIATSLRIDAVASTPQEAAPVASPLPAYAPRFGRAKPIVAVIGENAFTELTDYVVPYGVLVESGAANVFALATREGPIQMFPALQLQPQATVAQFDERFPDGADYVIVPAVHRTEDAALIAWVKAQAAKGATIVGVCDGVWVLANAGLLKGKKAVGHWYSVDDLRRKFPETQFVADTRYLADGRIVTTTGVTASIPVSLAIVEAIAGREAAAKVARSLGVRDWSAAHRSRDFTLNARHMFTAAKNWTSFWTHDDIDIPVAQGVDEIALALVADAYSRTYRSSAYSRAASANPITTRRGLVMYPDRHADENITGRLVTLPVQMSPAASLDAALSGIEEAYGAATAEFVSLQLEYPRTDP